MDNLIRAIEKTRFVQKPSYTKAIENKSNSRKILFSSNKILPIWISFLGEKQELDLFCHKTFTINSNKLLIFDKSVFFLTRLWPQDPCPQNYIFHHWEILRSLHGPQPRQSLPPRHCPGKCGNL